MEPPPVRYTKTSDDIRLAYSICGRGEPLVYLPNVWGNFSGYWKTQMRMRRHYEALASRFQLIQYDSRGQGLSSRNLADLSWQDYVTDLAAVLDAVGVQQAILYGISFSTRIALRYAAEYPERVRAVVTWDYLDWWQQPRAEALIKMVAEDWDYFVDLSSRSQFGPDDPEEVRRVITDAQVQQDFILLSRLLSGEDAELEDILRRVQAPALLMSRPSYALERVKWAASLIPGARLIAFDDRDGGLTAEDPLQAPAFLALTAFVDSLPAIDPAPGGAKAIPAVEQLGQAGPVLAAAAIRQRSPGDCGDLHRRVPVASRRRTQVRSGARTAADVARRTCGGQKGDPGVLCQEC